MHSHGRTYHGHTHRIGDPPDDPPCRDCSLGDLNPDATCHTKAHSNKLMKKAAELVDKEGWERAQAMFWSGLAIGRRKIFISWGSGFIMLFLAWEGVSLEGARAGLIGPRLVLMVRRNNRRAVPRNEEDGEIRNSGLYFGEGRT